MAIAIIITQIPTAMPPMAIRMMGVERRLLPLLDCKSLRARNADVLKLI